MCSENLRRSAVGRGPRVLMQQSTHDGLYTEVCGVPRTEGSSLASGSQTKSPQIRTTWDLELNVQHAFIN